MQDYLIIFQDNSLETRKTQHIQCKPEDLLKEAIAFTNYIGCTNLIEISHASRDMDWNFTVIDLKTNTIVE